MPVNMQLYTAPLEVLLLLCSCEPRPPITRDTYDTVYCPNVAFPSPEELCGWLKTEGEETCLHNPEQCVTAHCEEEENAGWCDNDVITLTTVEAIEKAREWCVSFNKNYLEYKEQHCDKKYVQDYFVKCFQSPCD